MHAGLIVNPLATIDIEDATGVLISGGPVPGRGLKYLRISPTDDPRLYSLFDELHAVGIAYLNIETDVNEDEVEVLVDHGILIDHKNVPERPLFACMLTDVEEASMIPHDLIVNPTLEFQPFDLANFRSWIRDRHLSPYFASVWVTDPATEMRWGYWLEPQHVKLIEEFAAGRGNVTDLNRSTAALLHAAAILVDPNTKPDAMSATTAEFRDKLYSIIDTVVPPAQLRALQTYYRNYVEQGFMKFGDEQVERRFSEHGEHVAEMVHKSMTSLMSRVAGVQVKPTYAHSAVYAEGADLKPHVDREACEFSFSFQLDYLPKPENDISPWPLYLSRRSIDDMSIDPDNDLAILLPTGSFLAYKGRELVHYRTPLPQGHRSTSLFFHYIPA